MAELDHAFFLHRLIQRLLARQADYKIRADYVEGNHPLPNADRRYVRALHEIQRKAKTNYVGLANKAVTDGMRVVGFKFAGQVDQDAQRIWSANNMPLKAQTAIKQAAKLGDVYIMVSPPGPDGIPIITVEDPRICIVEPDPLDPMNSVCGLKLYEDSMTGTVTAVLIDPNSISTYVASSMRDFLLREKTYTPENIISNSGGFTLADQQVNPLGSMPLIRGAWQPEYGIKGMAECEDGGFDIQDRINLGVLLRLVTAKSQAFRQRWMTGAKVAKNADGTVKKTPFDPGADMIWAVADPDTKFGDFDQVDIRQALEAIRDDIGDFAAITQTPVTYLTGRMVNVSGDALTAAQVSLNSKKRTRIEAMGWFFEAVMKTCFAYSNDPRAFEIEAETLWADPEVRTLAELADMVSKFSAAGVPPRFYLERAGFSPAEVEAAVGEMEAKQQQNMADQIALQSAKPDPQPADNNGPQSNPAPQAGSE